MEDNLSKKRKLTFATVSLSEFSRAPEGVLLDADIRPVGISRDNNGDLTHIVLSRHEYSSLVHFRERRMKELFNDPEFLAELVSERPKHAKNAPEAY